MQTDNPCLRGNSTLPYLNQQNVKAVAMLVAPILCHVAVDQVGKLVEAIELGPQWLEEVLAIISLKNEVEWVKEKRQL